MKTNPLIDGAANLSHWGVIRAHGPDAAAFLHGQLTNDVSQMSGAQARLSGYCSAKGRLLASFITWKPAVDEVLLACHRSVLPATLKRLSMFVLRAQCKLSDASSEVPLRGLAGPAAASICAGADIWARTSTAIRLPDSAGLPRALQVAAQDATPFAPIELDAWRWLEVQSGVPVIEAATSEQFVPQMLNFELLDGVNFQKGCYPGQEVVARSQYRGTTKRRMFLFDIDAPAQAGQEVFHGAEPGQPAGMVVNAAPHPSEGGFSALVEIKLAALESGTLHLQTPDGPPLLRREMPYAVLDADRAA